MSPGPDRSMFREFLDGEPPGPYVQGFVAMVAWIGGDGERHWTFWVDTADVEIDNVIGFMEVMKTRLVARRIEELKE